MADATTEFFEKLALFAGIAGELVVSAFQFGSGLVALITPTSAVVMGGLAIARVGYGTWWKFSLPILLFLSWGHSPWLASPSPRRCSPRQKANPAQGVL
jgi:uncharacterized ion transporter superfamily protein YfcC